MAIFAVPAAAQQPVVYGGGVRTRPAQTAGNGIPIGSSAIPQPAMQRQPATFSTPFPTRPAPGPVRTTYDQSAPQPQPVQQVAAAPVQQPRPGGAATPGAAGKVMYFHKAEGATTADGPPDNSTVAMAAFQEVPAAASDAPSAPPGVPQPVTIPMTVIEKPIVPPNLEPVLPTQPFNATTPESQPFETRPVFQPQEKEKEKEKEKERPKIDPKIPELPPDVTQLPPRSAILNVLDDAKLELSIRESILTHMNKNLKPDQPKKSLDDLMPFPVLKPAVPAGTQYVAKTATLPPGHVTYEPGFVIHRRLHFEERNSERYGWDFGLATPFISTASFYKNILLWPNSLATSLVIGGMDTNMGKCLPGSPTPYYLYPQGLTITGGVAEGLVITGLSFVIP